MIQITDFQERLLKSLVRSGSNIFVVAGASNNDEAMAASEAEFPESRQMWELEKAGLIQNISKDHAPTLKHYKEKFGFDFSVMRMSKAVMVLFSDTKNRTVN